eukprot:1882088-Amphidinium_carterae.1
MRCRIALILDTPVLRDRLTQCVCGGAVCVWTGKSERKPAREESRHCAIKQAAEVVKKACIDALGRTKKKSSPLEVGSLKHKIVALIYLIGEWLLCGL